KQDKLRLFAAVVLRALAGGGTFAVLHFTGGGDEDEKVETAAADATGADGEHATPARAPVTYFPFEPPFLTNFVVNGRPRYLQLSLAVASRDQATLDALQKHMPLVRNRVVMLLSGEQFDLLRTRAGRDALQTKLQDAIKQVLEKEAVKPDVERVLFTNFV